VKIKVFQPKVQFEQMSNGGEVEPAKMFGGGGININVDVDPERVAAYMANNPVVADKVGETAPQRVTASPTTEEVDAFNYLYGPSASEAAGFNVEQSAYGNDYAQYDRGDYVRSTDPAAAAERAAEQERRRQERQAQQEADADAEAERRAAEQAAADVEFQRRLAAGELSPEELQNFIDGGMSEQQVLQLISTYQLSETQLAQLFEQGLLTREQIEELVSSQAGESAEEAVEQAVAAGLTEEQVNELIQQGVDQSAPDMSQYVTQSGLETLFQNYLTPEQLEAYLPQDQTETITALEKKIADLEQQYSDVTSQYEADAVNQQISDAKEEVQNFYASSVPTGPRTGSTSQFDAGASFLPGGSPMASLIGSQREGQGQDPFTSYLKTFTPSYSEYNEPFTPEEYNERNQPFTGGMYNNPFTGGMSYNPDKKNMGGQVSNGIMDLTNFDTNVQPFQNAFRPNVPRN